MEYRVEGRRPVGRPRKTWLEIVEADMAKLEIDKEDVYDRSIWRRNVNVMKRKSPGVDWLSPNMSSMTTPLVDLCDYLFLSQQVHKPTRISNILYYIFCPNDLIKTNRLRI